MTKQMNAEEYFFYADYLIIRSPNNNLNIMQIIAKLSVWPAVSYFYLLWNIQGDTYIENQW